MERYNPLELKIRMVSLPRKTKSLTYWQTLLRALDSGAELPRGWDVEISWRNPMTRSGVTKKWRSDAFADAVNESRAGFITGVRDMIVSKIDYHRRMTNALRAGTLRPKKRRAR